MQRARLKQSGWQIRLIGCLQNFPVASNNASQSPEPLSLNHLSCLQMSPRGRSIASQVVQLSISCGVLIGPAAQ